MCLLTMMLFFSISFFSSLVSADELNLKITGTINGYSSDVYLVTNPSASLIVDAYDMPSPSSPDNYSQFYSDGSLGSLAIDSWNFASTSRTIDLVYHISEAQTGTLALVWDNSAIDSATYDVSLQDYGTDSSYTTQVGSDINMISSTTYSTELTGDDDIYIRVIVEPHTAADAGDTGGNTGGGGSSGGGGAVVTVSDGLVLGNDFVNVKIALTKTTNRKISIYNSGNKTETINLKSSGLTGILLIDPNDISFTLAPGEKREITIAVTAPTKEGNYEGSMFINKHKVIIDVDVSTTELLFDAGIDIPTSSKLINKGDNLQFQVTLIPMGNEPGVDVTLNYEIRNENGQIVYTHSYTKLVEKQISFTETFEELGLGPGKYTLHLELVYPNAIATSSSSFEIKGSELPIFTKTSIIIMISSGIGILIIIIITIVISKGRKIKKHKKR